MTPTVRSAARAASSLASSSTQYSSSSVTVGVLASAIVTDPSGVGNVPLVAVVVILAMAASELIANVMLPLPLVTLMPVPAVSVALASVLPVVLPISSWPSV